MKKLLVIAALLVAGSAYTTQTNTVDPYWAFPCIACGSNVVAASSTAFRGAMVLRNIVVKAAVLRVTGHVVNGSGTMIVALKDTLTGVSTASVYITSQAATNWVDSKQFVTTSAAHRQNRMYYISLTSSDLNTTSWLDSVMLVAP